MVSTKYSEAALRYASEELQNDPEILEAIRNQKKQKEQHTSKKIAKGINPTQSAINAVQEEMIAEQAREENSQVGKKFEQEQ